jgi:hypothetical protein
MIKTSAERSAAIAEKIEAVSKMVAEARDNVIDGTACGPKT